jgi:uncharacterized protein (TIGR03435 family)
MTENRSPFEQADHGAGVLVASTRIQNGCEPGRLGPNLKQSTADCSQVKPQILDNGFASLDRPLIDKSGLSGLFDINFLWAPLDASDDGPGRVILITGAQDRLGLKVQPAVGPVEQLVIDSAERPTPD